MDSVVLFQNKINHILYDFFLSYTLDKKTK